MRYICNARCHSRFSAFFLFSIPECPVAADLFPDLAVVISDVPETFELAVDSGIGVTRSLLDVDVARELVIVLDNDG